MQAAATTKDCGPPQLKMLMLLALRPGETISEQALI
jgi:DNA-binding winged helix-turn-helix (wHTH) protein